MAKALLLAALLLGACVSLFHLFQLLPVVNENMHTEASSAVVVQRWAQGNPLYPDFRQAPYLLTPFPPAWYAVMRVVYALGVHSVEGLLLAGRLITLAAMAAALAMVFVFARTMKIRAVQALTPVCLFLLIPTLDPWAVIARQDFPSLLLAVAALWVASQERRWSIEVAAVLAALSFLAKHSSVAVPVAIVLWLVWQGRVRAIVTFCAIWGVIVLPLMAALQWRSHGQFLQHISGAKFGPSSFWNLHSLFIGFFYESGSQSNLLLLGLALGGFVFALYSEDRRLKLLAFYFGSTAFFACFAMRFANAGLNHFFEPALAWTLLACVTVNRIVEANDERTTLTALLALVILVPSLDIAVWRMRNQRAVDIEDIAHWAAPQQVFTDAPFIAAHTARPMLLDPISLTYSERAGAWSSAGVEQEIRTHAFSTVVLERSLERPQAEPARYPRLSPRVKSAIAESYSYCFSYRGLSFYAPKGASCPLQKEIERAR